MALMIIAYAILYGGGALAIVAIIHSIRTAP